MVDKPSELQTLKPGDKKEPVVVKKYANRRLYNTETSTYVTLDDLAAMVKAERDFVVYDAKSSDDLTHSVLTQIIVEQEGRLDSGQTMLPIPFLRQLIRFYGDSVGKMVPSYLQVSLDTLSREQVKMREQFASAFNPQSALDAYHEQARKNLAMFEQAMKMFSPFSATTTAGVPPSKSDPATLSATAKATAAPTSVANDSAASHLSVVRPATPSTATPATPDAMAEMRTQLAENRAQLAAMQAMMDKLVKERG